MSTIDEVTAEEFIRRVRYLIVNAKHLYRQRDAKGPTDQKLECNFCGAKTPAARGFTDFPHRRDCIVAKLGELTIPADPDPEAAKNAAIKTLADLGYIVTIQRWRDL